MAAKTFRELDGALEVPSQTLAAGDTVVNNTAGLITITKGAVNTIGASKVIREVPEFERIVVPVGGTSAALPTLAAGEAFYFVNQHTSMASTVSSSIV